MPEILLDAGGKTIPLWITLEPEATQEPEVLQADLNEERLHPPIQKILQLMKKVYGIIYIALSCEINKKTFTAHAEASLMEEDERRRFQAKATSKEKLQAHLEALQNLYDQLDIYSNIQGYYLLLDNPLLPVFCHHPHMSGRTARPNEFLGWLKRQREIHPIQEAAMRIGRDSKNYKVILDLFISSLQPNRPLYLSAKMTGTKLQDAKAMAFNALAEELRAQKKAK